MADLQLSTNHIKSSSRHKQASDIRRTDLITSAYKRISAANQYTLTHQGTTCSIGIARNS